MFTPWMFWHTTDRHELHEDLAATRSECGELSAQLPSMHGFMGTMLFQRRVNKALAQQVLFVVGGV